MSNELIPGNADAERTLRDGVIRLVVVAVLAWSCLTILSPFMLLLLWGLVLAIAIYPAHQRLAAALGNRQGRAATALVMVGVLGIGIPTFMLGSSFAAQLQDTYQAFAEDTVTIPPPPPGIEEWPLIGKPLHEAWLAAAEDTPAYIAAHQAEIRQTAMRVLGMAANTASSIGLLLGSLIVAGVMVAWGKEGSGAIGRVLERFAGRKRGRHLQVLATATVRSVASGVLGVAVIQALLLGIGFLIAGIPGAGILALVSLMIGIAQLPALIVSIPAIIYLWSAGDGSMLVNIGATIYLILAGFADNVLKPLLLARGVDAPMPVILIGALGGMVTGGIIGLFLGAVVLTIGYVLFMEWVDGENAATAEIESATAEG